MPRPAPELVTKQCAACLGSGVGCDVCDGQGTVRRRVRAAKPRPARRPPRTPRPHVDLERGLYAIRLLREQPISPGDLARTLGVSRDTVDRLFAAIRRAGLQLTRTKRGRYTYYSLPPDTLARVMG